MHLARTRSLFLMASLVCVLILGTVLYIQHAFGLEPCLLCLVQRAAMIGCAALAMVAAFHAPGAEGWRRYCAAMLVITCVGVTTAGFQVWLQTAPAEDLMPAIDTLQSGLDVLSLTTWSGSARSAASFCAVITWSLFGLSLPEWSLLAFVGLALMPFYVLFVDLNPWKAAESRIEH